MARNVKLIDGGVDQGSRLLTINVGETNASTTATDYATDDFSWDRDSNFSDRTDQNNVINGTVGIVGPITGSATLQLAALTTPEPTVFNTFNEDYNGDTVTCYITSVGRRETKAGVTTIAITFRVATTTSVVVRDSDGNETTMSSVQIP